MATRKARAKVEPDQLKDGERAVQQLKAQIEAVGEVARTPRKPLVSVVQEVLARQPALVASLRAIKPGVLDAGHVAGLVASAEQIPVVCQALLYTETQVLALRSVVRTKSADEVRLNDLRERALGVVRGLVATGHVPQETLKAITRGHGKVDHARDAVQLADLLTAKWAQAEGLMAAASADAAKISAEERDALHTLGLKALEESKAAPNEALEAHEVRYAALHELLKRTWDATGRALRYAANSGAYAGELPPTWLGLR
jgi:hypothetical protein